LRLLPCFNSRSTFRKFSTSLHLLPLVTVQRMSGPSLFRRLREAEQLLEVGVDDVQLLSPGSNKRAIGTQGLNGCTCVVMLGTAILLAHIAPLPGSYEQWRSTDRDVRQASYDHHEDSLQNVARKNAHEFPTSSTAWGIFSQGPQGSMQTVIQQVQTHLSSIGYEIRPAFYHEINPERARAPKGELVSFHNRSGVAELWLESRKLWPKAEPPSSLTSSATGNAYIKLSLYHCIAN